MASALLDRNTRPVRLTPIGRELPPVIERILRELESVLLNTQALSAKASGFVAVAALPTLSATMPPGIIAAFRAGNPFGEPEVEFAPLFNDSMSAIVPRQSPFAQKRSVPLRDLAATPLILMGRDSSVRTVVDRALADIGHFSPPDYEAGYIFTALGMVEAGLGITILPSSVLRMSRSRELVSRPIREPGIDREVGLLQMRGRSLSKAAAFQRAIRGKCSELYSRRKR